METASTQSRDTYDAALIEARWQDAWRESEQFRTPPVQAGVTDSYVFVALPFTSGDIHMGHVRSYAIADAHARFRRARGESVLFVLGFDAFGLPAETGAAVRRMEPALWVDQCRAKMQAQLERLGMSFDWSRTYATSESEVYRWSQYLFLALYEGGLVYRAEGYAYRCDPCDTVLAAQQVNEGCCWRCGQDVQLRRQPQWYLRLSAYNEENDRRLASLDGWNRLAISEQRSLLGRVEGVELEVYLANESELTVFTCHPDAISDASFVALSPFHPELDILVADETIDGKLREHRSAGDSAGRKGSIVVNSGIFAQLPGVAKPLPIIVSPSVETLYGPTAVLGLPSIDREHEAIAARLPAAPAMSWSLKKPLRTRPAVRYRAGDVSVSRQRSWGTPVPIVHCEDCGLVPIPNDELPVRLPTVRASSVDHNGIGRDEEFTSCACPTCGAAARRDTDTLDCHFDISWAYIAGTVPKAERDGAIFENPEVRRWLPAAQIVHGVDTGGFVLDERAVAKALRDLGIVHISPTGEPYVGAVMHEMVQLNGRKMSKHLGNVVSPQELVDEMGADTLRLAMLYAAAPQKSFSWTPGVLHQAQTFLRRLWTFAEPRLSWGANLPDQIDTSSRFRRRLLVWCDTATERITENLDGLNVHLAVRNAIKLLDRIIAFERKVTASGSELNDSDREAIAFSLLRLVQLLAPLAPHVAEELWARAGNRESVGSAPWPCSAGNET